MAKGFPSMTALLGLIAVAGYQNREKLAEMLGSQSSKAPTGQGEQHGGLSSILGSLTGGIGGAGAGGFLSGGLRELVEHFQNRGQGHVADSWVGTGPNQEVAPQDLEQALGPDVIADLVQRTGLSRDELISRLSKQLPSAVDKYTPDGRIPT
jgi:uncharacterized protein YidB (DUF937 family)